MAAGICGLMQIETHDFWADELQPGRSALNVPNGEKNDPKFDALRQKHGNFSK